MWRASKIPDVVEDRFLLPSAGQDDSRCLCTHGSSWVHVWAPQSQVRISQVIPSSTQDSWVFRSGRCHSVPKVLRGFFWPPIPTVDSSELKWILLKWMWRPFHNRSVLFKAPKDRRRDYKGDNNLQSGISNNLGFAGQVILLRPYIVSIPWMQAHCLELETQDTNQGLGKKNGNDPLVSVGCFLISFTLNILKKVGALPQEAAR